MSSANKGVEYLVSAARAANNGTAVHLQALSALGDAGGPAAQEYLISVARAANSGTKVHMTALEALGRASREKP
ncbi:hypothetical protein [Pseudomonas sp. BC115LW]|uniref:hypothetical protein n=1 Tax=Pseudomonas sp. BC115LW TaxID=2683267 RepID=UPI001411F056|nr:hypothetical protein [Pseudomonas sp. BC115LW]NBB33765.1 hypothetical protein [Pseudomonas sp. BC115LW]